MPQAIPLIKNRSFTPRNHLPSFLLFFPKGRIILQESPHLPEISLLAPTFFSYLFIFLLVSTSSSVEESGASRVLNRVLLDISFLGPPGASEIHHLEMKSSGRNEDFNANMITSKPGLFSNAVFIHR